MDYLLATSLGGLVAFAFSLPAIVLELSQRGPMENAPLLVDVKTIFGRRLARQEVFWAALLFHIVIGGLFGLLYVLFVERGWLFVTPAPYTLLSLIVYAVLSWIVAGTILFPLLRMGFFGRREGERVWLEMLISHFVFGLGLWLLVQYFQPVYFS